eukprot:m.1116579 g.1116579  ORF g.1116579 m.1116579 type:complete len:669 (-) comp24377_c1_seq8:1894-3900(-)
METKKTINDIRKHRHKNRGAARMKDTLAKTQPFSPKALTERVAYNRNRNILRKSTIGRKNLNAATFGHNNATSSKREALPKSQHGDWVTAKQPKNTIPSVPHTTTFSAPSPVSIPARERTSSKIFTSPKHKNYTAASIQAVCGPKSVQWRPKAALSSQRYRPLKDAKQRELSFKSSNEFYSRKSSEGFTNLGNTCYVNSGIQALLAIKPFVSDIVRYVDADHESRAGDGGSAKKSIGPLTNALQSILQQTKKMNSSTAMDSSAVKKALEQHFPRFVGNAQHDVHEFIGCLLDQLDSESTSNASPGNDVRWDSSSIANETFACEVSHTRTCLNDVCSAADSSVNELFRTFSLDILRGSDSSLGLSASSTNQVHSPSIQSLLESFFASEEVEYKCETCSHQQSRIQHRLKTLPRVLVLHLKRFDSVTGDKIKQRVQVSKYLSLDFCCDSKTRPPPHVTLIDGHEDTSVIADATEGSAELASTEDTERGSATHLRRRLDFIPTEQQAMLQPRVSRADNSHPALGMTDEEQLQLALRRSMEDAGTGGSSTAATSKIGVTHDIHSDDDAECEQIHPLFPHHAGAVDDTTPWRDPPLSIRPSSENCYRLVSLVHHSGVSAQSGHYVCDVWNSATDTWKCFNDSLVSIVDESAVLGPDRRKNAYLLFYVHQQHTK